MISENTDLDSPAKPTRRAELDAGLLKGFAAALDISSESVDRTKSFTAFGLDSVKAFALTGDLAEWLDQDLPATLFWDYPNIEVLSDFLAKSLGLTE